MDVSEKERHAVNDPQATIAAQQAEAQRYAVLLEWGARIGLLLLLVSFALYVFGGLRPHFPLERLPEVWNLPVADYLQRTGTPRGWHWLARVHQADLSNLIGIALLAGCSMPPLVGLIILYLRRRDFIYGAICAVVTGVLVLAAAGVFSIGH